MSDLLQPNIVSQNTQPNAVVTIDDQWHVTACTSKAEDLLGLAAADIIGKDCRDLADRYEHFAELIGIYAPLSIGRAVMDFRVVLKKGEGINHVLLITAVPIPKTGGEFGGAVVALHDADDPTLIYRLVMDSITDGVFTVDRTMRILAFNQAAERITGWKKEKVLGRPCSEVFHSSICGDACILAESVRSGRPSSAPCTVYIKARSGRTVPISISAAPLLDPEGNVIGGVETFRDITATIEQEIIMDSIADGVFAVDRDMRITAFNPAAEKITGWSRGEVLGRPCSEIFHSSICGDGCLLAKSLTSGATCSMATVFVKAKDGRTVPISISAAPLLDPDGNIIGGVETFRDKTERIQQEMIFDSVADGVFTVDRNWRITSFNRAAEQITGWPRQEAIGRFCSDVFHSNICGKDCAIAQSMYLGRPVANRSILIKNAGGAQMPISISAAPLLDHEGNVIGGVETFRDLTMLTELRKQLFRRYTFGEILSKSPIMQNIFRILPEIATSDSNVLVLGESGTGKELIARAIHNSSQRSNGPFVAVNCGALPETLLESELFGYKAGAFTDAKQDRQGRFAAAEKGTLFLDEIGDIPAALQVKLLRVLQEKVYEPLGSNRPVKADVRIIAATNRDLQTLVRQGAFREDLYYRLNVVRILLPPLKKRMEDIPMLIEHFVKQFSAQKGKDIVGISEAALGILMRHDFPGNIRELENIIEYAFILCHGGFIQPGHLPEPFAPAEKDALLPQAGSRPAGQTTTLEEIEKNAIHEALERNRWKRMAVCRELGISKDTLRRKVQRYHLQPPFDVEEEA